MSKKQTITDTLRRAVLEADKTRYRLGVETGIAQSTLCRFAHGGGLYSDSIDKLADALELELQPRRPAKGKKR